MKRLLFIFLITALSVSGFAQFSDKIVESKYYRVFFQENEQEAVLTAQKLDAYFDFYNSYFHFDTSAMPSRLNVKILDSKSAYADYVSASTTVSNPVSSFLFIQYRDASKSELIGYKNNNPDFEDTLSHYSFIQFFRNFITNPPLWLEKGFAVYFGKSFYSPSKSAVIYKENLTWLNTLKSFLDADPPALIDLNTLFSMNTEEVTEDSDLFYAQSWGLVKFLIENPKAVYNRVIWDSINKLSPDASKTQNEENVKRSFAWLDSAEFSKDFYEYITALKTFPQLVDSGIALYEKEKYDEAKMALIKAVTMEDTNYIPYYYLGLIHYNTEDYAMADFYYNSALQMNGDKAICYYALGVNAFAEQDYERSVKYLKTAVACSPEYRERTDKIIDNIRTILRLQNRTMDIEAIEPYQIPTEERKEAAPVSPDITVTTTAPEAAEAPVTIEDESPAEEAIDAPVQPEEEDEVGRLRLDKDTGEYILIN